MHWISCCLVFFLSNIELCNTNQTFKFILQKSTNLFSPIKCYGEQIACICKTIDNNMTTMHERLKPKKQIV